MADNLFISLVAGGEGTGSTRDNKIVKILFNLQLTKDLRAEVIKSFVTFHCRVIELKKYLLQAPRQLALPRCVSKSIINLRGKQLKINDEDGVYNY